MGTVKFLANCSPRFVAGEETFQAKVGFNEMPDKFAKDPYYKMCKDDKSIQDFVSNPTDQQHEEFDKMVQAERERADALQKELDDLKAAQQPEKEDKKK